MINQIHDNSAVENYLKELSAREAEKTQSYRVQNFVKEAPYKVLRTGGVILAVAILLYFLGLGIGNARSFEVVTINENIETRNGYESVTSDSTQEINAQDHNQDQLINLDEILLDQEKVIPTSIEENIPVQGTAVRNYYIFDSIPLAGQTIKELTIGRMFSSPDSPPDLEYCYVEVRGRDGLSKRLDLVELKSGKREETEINSKIAESLQVSIEELKGAQSRCTL
tara:strand:- start:160 stop:834 length:675 start_codon:yes stop_codon:yes gene_type:complete